MSIFTSSTIAMRLHMVLSTVDDYLGVGADELIDDYDHRIIEIEEGMLSPSSIDRWRAGSKLDDLEQHLRDDVGLALVPEDHGWFGKTRWLKGIRRIFDLPAWGAVDHKKLSDKSIRYGARDSGSEVASPMMRELLNRYDRDKPASVRRVIERMQTEGLPTNKPFFVSAYHFATRDPLKLSSRQGIEVYLSIVGASPEFADMIALLLECGEDDIRALPMLRAIIKHLPYSIHEEHIPGILKVFQQAPYSSGDQKLLLGLARNEPRLLPSLIENGIDEHGNLLVLPETYQRFFAQYQYPDGMYFGGEATQQSREMLMAHSEALRSNDDPIAARRAWSFMSAVGVFDNEVRRITGHIHYRENTDLLIANNYSSPLLGGVMFQWGMHPMERGDDEGLGDYRNAIAIANHLLDEREDLDLDSFSFLWRQGPMFLYSDKDLWFRNEGGLEALTRVIEWQMARLDPGSVRVHVVGGFRNEIYVDMDGYVYLFGEQAFFARAMMRTEEGSHRLNPRFEMAFRAAFSRHSGDPNYQALAEYWLR